MTSMTFSNEPLADFTRASNRQQFEEALTRVSARISAGTYQAHPIINGETVRVSEHYCSVDPSDPEVTVGTVWYATENECALALDALGRGFWHWRASPWEERAKIVYALGDLIAAERYHLAALICREAGKPWREADGDVVEAIDFCRYYACEMQRFGPPHRTQEVVGEACTLVYQPRGISVVISPWNFPLAIACGMTVAALVTGNAVILKPAEQTSLIAAELARLILKAGVPKDVFAFLPGAGEKIGKFLVNHAATALICFTGSRDVGLEIISSAANLRPGQHHIKRVIAEMGGKNAIIVDEDGDPDEALKGILSSAFGYAGQKCSACSRLIVVGDAYEPLLERLAEAATDLIVGSASDPATYVGPVIDRSARARIQEAISEARKNQRLLCEGKVPEKGFFVAPTIFQDVDKASSLWRDEIFGPVLACTRAKSFEHALTLANDSQYALTGGLFSRSPESIAIAKRDFLVGNLYINRATTGAVVERHPFGGFKLSGIGSKAGGTDYLLQFLEPRTIAENTMRRGFTPGS
jgi:RHH-type transcriptional regulator, proline utilization regulon repressor / proline dehydrogenase / delta 1-pyrroline-5-carboxylate dehydrogenase